MDLIVKFNGYTLNVIQKHGLTEETLNEFKLTRKFWSNIWSLKQKDNEQIASFKIKTKIPFLNLDYIMTIQLHQTKATKMIINYKEKTPHILFTFDNSNYLFVFHTDNSVSLFKNEIQFASLIKRNLTIGGSQEFLVRVDDNVNVRFLIIILCIIIITMYEGPEQSDFILDIDGSFKELRAKNKNWIPKSLLNL